MHQVPQVRSHEGLFGCSPPFIGLLNNLMAIVSGGFNAIASRACQNSACSASISTHLVNRDTYEDAISDHLTAAYHPWSPVSNQSPSPIVYPPHIHTPCARPAQGARIVSAGGASFQARRGDKHGRGRV